MNILLININIGKEWGWGGIESHTDLLASALAENGHRVIMGCWKEGAVTLHSGKILLPAKRINIANSGDVYAILKIITASLREKIDVIIANNGREYWPAAIGAILSGARIIFIRHQTDKIKRSTRWLINRHIEKVIAVSRAVRNALLKSGISEEKIEIIHNSVDMWKFSPQGLDKNEIRQGLGIGRNDMVIGSVGKLNKGKGVYDLLHAVGKMSEKHPLLKLLFVGDGQEREGLELEAERLSIKDRVAFAGIRKDVEKMYSAMDIFVLPSVCEEAFGMVIIEAMSMGKPVIATTVGGIPEIIKDGVNGMLIPPGDSASIANAIERLIDNPDFCKTISAEGRKTVENNFSDMAMGERFDAILRETAG